MRILITLAAALAIMAGLVVGIVLAGTAISRAGQSAVAATSVTSGTLSKVAFAVLWVLVAGVSAGLIGSS